MVQADFTHIKRHQRRPIIVNVRVDVNAQDNYVPKPRETPEEALVRLGHELERAWATYRQIVNRKRVGDAAVEAQNKICMNIADKIADIQATTLKWLLVKARAVLFCHNGNFEGIADWSMDGRIASNIITDLLSIKA